MKQFARSATLVLLALASPPSAPQTIPIRKLGPVIARSADSVRRPAIVRGMSDGSVLVNEYSRRRLVRFDPALGQLVVVMDSASTQTSTSLVPLGGDSSLYADPQSRTLLVLDRNGRTVRTIAAPTAGDFTYIAFGANYGNPSVDPKGRLIYRGSFPPTAGISPYGPIVAQLMAASPDSAPLLRADLDARRVDTIGIVRLRSETRPTSVAPNEHGDLVVKIAMNPFALIDDWMMLPDGSVAIVRFQDYHVDWVDADGSRRSTPKLPIDWRPLTDAVKQARVDSLRPNIERSESMMNSRGTAIPTPGGTRKLMYKVEFAQFSEMPDYVPPFTLGTNVVDPDGNLWLLPRTSLAVSSDGLLYDVVNRSGRIVERVRVPAGCELAGFAGGGIALLLRAGSNGYAFLETARIR